MHGPEYISKGKAHKRYEFGCKVRVAATGRGGWFVGAGAFHGNPYDGHSLSKAAQAPQIAQQPEHVFVDMGYRGHAYQGGTQVHVDKRQRDRTAKSLGRWLQRRAAIEPDIGYLKRGHRMDRNRLAGVGACGKNLFERGQARCGRIRGFPDCSETGFGILPMKTNSLIILNLFSQSVALPSIAGNYPAA